MIFNNIYIFQNLEPLTISYSANQPIDSQL